MAPKPSPAPGLWERVEAGGDEFIRAELCHHIEFQTLRRLPASRYICFTVRTYSDRVAEVRPPPLPPLVEPRRRCAALTARRRQLEKYPACAASLAAAIRRKPKARPA